MEKFAFKCEWRDSHVNLCKPLLLFIYPEDSSLELMDPVLRKSFLKRTKTELPSIIQPGKQVSIIGRNLHVLDYADQYTRDNWKRVHETTVVLVQNGLADLFEWMKEWWTLKMLKLESVRVIRVQNDQIRGIHPGLYFAMEWSGYDSLLYFQNDFYRSNDGAAALVLEDITRAGFTITDASLENLTPNQANEFLEVYQTILPNYKEMVDELSSGPCMVLEVICKKSTVLEFRKLAGPHDPILAKRACPSSLRAKYGQDISKNAIHCTDLEDDGKLEIEYMFHLLPMQRTK